jgi:LmbE family N-acetylglucosaminyl deacetylase
MILDSLVRERELGTGPALIIAPHADDEILGCGGWLIRTRQMPLSHVIVFLTIRSAIRREASECAHAGLGIRVIDLELRERAAISELDDGHVERLSTLIRKIQPAYIFIPNRHDAHPDHKAAHALLRRALMRTESMSRITVAEYEGLEPLGQADWMLNISDVAAEKWDRLRAFADQEQRYGLSGIARDLNAYRAKTLMRRGVLYAEAYKRVDRKEYLS